MALAVELPAAGEPPAFLSTNSAAVDAALRRLAPSRSGRAGAMCAYHMGWRDAVQSNVRGNSRLAHHRG